jgi:hypothetical protein
VRQTVGNCVVGELMTVKPRQAAASAKPKITLGIAADLVNPVSRQTVFGGEHTDRQLLGVEEGAEH